MGTLEEMCRVFGKVIEVLGSTSRKPVLARPAGLMVPCVRTDEIGRFRRGIGMDAGSREGE